ncbi:hypothetical protein T02_5153 [Trichinella nativa]|uniref:Uncharacterized protein n=1 Tax=Trichinella nativa TaxID=6335 RepID=A0A0V1LGR2_9BILA|nr:hypothetical protein T02_5153 [Trichinella nativa]
MKETKEKATCGLPFGRHLYACEGSIDQRMPKAKKLPLLASGLGRRRSPSINRFPAVLSPSLEHLQNLSIDAFLGSRQDRFNEVTGDASLSHKKPQIRPGAQVQCLLVSRRLQSLPCHLQPRSRMGCKYACCVQQCRLQLANIGPVRWSGKPDTKAPKQINVNVHQTRLSHIQ